MSVIHKRIAVDPSTGLTRLPDTKAPVTCPRLHTEIPADFCKDLCLCSISLQIDGQLQSFCVEGKITEDIKGG